MTFTDDWRKNPEAAWDAFVEEYSGAVLAVVRRMLDDEDARMETYLFIMERLSANGARKLRTYDGGPDDSGRRFHAWLKVVARNLTVDWIRAQQGRRVIPRSIASMEPLDREIFRLAFWEKRTRSEIVEDVRMTSGLDLTITELGRRLQRIEGRLPASFMGNLVNEENVRRGTPLSLDEDSVLQQAGSGPDAKATWPHPQEWLERAEVRRGFRQAVAKLDEEEARISRLRFQQEWTAKEIAEELGIEDYRSLYPRLVRLTRFLRNELNDWKPHSDDPETLSAG